ncbi:hypothetical protein NIES2119_15335 [[Phormidium ambiguum] IAM M-71]|uniref:Uncharacterized protein n=1 Tax=[Phormidium ambiguum] IAM M-71 TaxID=454136 RepID=A0A1U7II02_9CYAN|nr:hypothetical protein NIES2119_15335 [Phormidium ambiguum IAM M-71]
MSKHCVRIAKRKAVDKQGILVKISLSAKNEELLKSSKLNKSQSGRGIHYAIALTILDISLFCLKKLVKTLYATSPQYA